VGGVAKHFLSVWFYGKQWFFVFGGGAGERRGFEVRM
jgi:hypothetical protein